MAVRIGPAPSVHRTPGDFKTAVAGRGTVQVSGAMRAFPALLVAVAAASAANARDSLEIEFAGGVGHTLEEAQGGGPRDLSPSYPFTPALSARAAYDLSDRVSVGLSFMSVLGRDPDSFYIFDDPSAFKAVAGFVSARVHTSGASQFWFGAGFGIGHLIRLQQSDSFEHPRLSGRAGPSIEISAGARHFLWNPVAAGIDLHAVMWSNVEHAGAPNNPAATGLTTWALLLLVSCTVAPWR